MSLFLLLAALAADPRSVPIGSKSTVEATQGLNAFGRCLANDRPVQVRALLAKDFREKSYAQAMQKLLHRRAPCPGVEIPKGAYASGTLAWGGALAEGMLHRDGMLANLKALTEYRADLPPIAARNSGEFMAFCVVRKDPEAVARLLRTEPASAEELEAIRSLSGSLPECVPAGAKSQFTREALRSLLASGAYQLAMHNGERRK